MSAEAVFLFKSEINLNEIKNTLNRMWDAIPGAEWLVSDSSYVYYGDIKGMVVCTLIYYYFTPEEEEKMRNVVKYLSSITLDNKLYYIPGPAFDSNKINWNPPVITVDDIFTKEECMPTVNTSVRNYLVK